VGNGGFEVFEVHGDMHVVFDLEFFKVALVSGHRGMHGVFENLCSESVSSRELQSLMKDRLGFILPFPSIIFVVKLVNTALPESEYISSCSADKLKCSMTCLRNRGSAIH
jgi:hypothetical protein